jgi:hypothetical protein
MANVLQKVTDTCWRLLHDPVLADGSFTIGFSTKTVPANFSIVAPTWQPNELDGDVTLQDAVEVEVIIAGAVTTPVPISVEKTGDTHLDFLITIHNDNAGEGVTSPALEIYITWGGR